MLYFKFPYFTARGGFAKVKNPRHPHKKTKTHRINLTTLDFSLSQKASLREAGNFSKKRQRR